MLIISRHLSILAESYKKIVEPLFYGNMFSLMAKNQQKTEESKALNFEQTITELNNIVDEMEQGQIPLQDSLKKYEKGMSLIKHCRGILQKAETKIEEITEKRQN